MQLRAPAGRGWDVVPRSTMDFESHPQFLSKEVNSKYFYLRLSLYAVGYSQQSLSRGKQCALLTSKVKIFYTVFFCQSAAAAILLKYAKTVDSICLYFIW